jgi:hypothetical protein
MQKVTALSRGKMLIGWREWVGLPALGVDRIKAKIDTGARTSALHAWNIRLVERRGHTWVGFDLHPVQRDSALVVACRARLLDVRDIRHSGGQTEQRYVIATELQLGDVAWPIELSLTNRDEMGFRMLIGRAALVGRATVDPGRSFLLARQPGRRI